jgi:hypothetical protein
MTQIGKLIFVILAHVSLKLVLLYLKRKYGKKPKSEQELNPENAKK